MYPFPHLRAETERLWESISFQLRARGVAAPAIPAPNEALTSDRLLDMWASPDLLFGQACGFPYVSELRDRVCLIGTPDFGLIAAKPGWYNSVILVRANDPRQTLSDFEGAILAYSEIGSQSGCWAMMYSALREVGERRLFGACLPTGAHVATISAIAKNQADIGAVDALTWRYLHPHLPEAATLRVLAVTEPTPGLPYIASNAFFTPDLVDATEAGIAALSDADRSKLSLVGFWRSVDRDYDIIAWRAAQSAGVFRLHGLDALR